MHSMVRMLDTNAKDQPKQKLLEWCDLILQPRRKLIHQQSELAARHLVKVQFHGFVRKVCVGILNPESEDAERIVVVLVTRS